MAGFQSQNSPTDSSDEANILRDLAIRSKNKCAFPGCDQPLLNSNDTYIAELCHIEAAEPGGQRYNPNQSDDERRSYGNLLFLCHPHHKATDDVEAFSVARLKQMKANHEALPEVVFNHDLLLQKIDAVAQEQTRIFSILEAAQSRSTTPTPFPIIGPALREAWTPEDGRFYESGDPTGIGFKMYAKDGWLHVEQRLPDGVIAYYELNEQGTCRQSQMPYPINEYRVEIPESLILRRSNVVSSVGTRAVRTDLKWSRGYVVEHYQGDLFAGADCETRCSIDHANRVIRVLLPPGA